MVEIVEDNVCLRFLDGWNAIKFDDTIWHKQGTMQQLRAMDILSCRDSVHWWIEIKDFRGYEAENQPRLSPNTSEEVVKTKEWLKSQGYENRVKVVRYKAYIVDEVLEKFRETLVSLLVAHRADNPEVGSYATAVQPGTDFSVALILLSDLRDFKRLALRLQDKVQRALTPYSVKGFVTDGTIPLPGQSWETDNALH